MKTITVKKIINRLNLWFLKGGRVSFSQAGEDLILNLIFSSKDKGTYIDIGANHPTRSSNTYFFYKKGWSGINIDALPDAIKLFQKLRRKDINIETGVSDEEAILKFYMFKETSYNTFNSELVEGIKEFSQLIDVKEIPVKKLSSILGQLNLDIIDFLTIDVEGLDLNVLKSNDWTLYRPKVILIEEFRHGIDVQNSEIYQYLISKGYIYFCQTLSNSFYIEPKFYSVRYNK